MSHSQESPPPNLPIQPLTPPYPFAHPFQYFTMPNCPTFRLRLSQHNFPPLRVYSTTTATRTINDRTCHCRNQGKNCNTRLTVYVMHVVCNISARQTMLDDARTDIIQTIGDSLIEIFINQILQILRCSLLPFNIS